MTNKPNILLLYSDQHSARSLGCYGNNEVYTAALDKLAAKGVKFTRAYTQNPICTPSRMSIMSGQYPHNFGHYGLMGKRPDNLPNMFKHMKKCGYATGMAGKLHTPSGWLSDHCDYVADGYGYEIPLKPWNKHNLQGHQGMCNDEYSLYLYKKGLGDIRPDKYVNETKNGLINTEALYSEIPEDDTIEAWAAGKTIEFIENANKEGKPFCFWMTVPHPHIPCVPAKRFWDMYDEDTLSFPPNAENDLADRHPVALDFWERHHNGNKDKKLKPDDWESFRKRVLHGYYACVTQMDDAMGRVLDKLDELGIRDNTIVVYASDHGDFAGEHGMIEKAPGIGFHCITRIPYIWSWPGHIPLNETRDCLVEAVDFFPTVCSLAGLPAPDWVDGVNIRESLEIGLSLKNIAVTETAYAKTIHTKKYKFTQYIPEMCDGRDSGELYDLENDEWEMENLYYKPEYRSIVNELRYTLYCWLVKSTRNITVMSSPTGFDGGGMKEWDLADELYDSDGKLSFRVAEKMIETRNMQHL